MAIKYWYQHKKTGLVPIFESHIPHVLKSNFDFGTQFMRYKWLSPKSWYNWCQVVSLQELIWCADFVLNIRVPYVTRPRPPHPIKAGLMVRFYWTGVNQIKAFFTWDIITYSQSIKGLFPPWELNHLISSPQFHSYLTCFTCSPPTPAMTCTAWTMTPSWPVWRQSLSRIG